MSHSKIHEKTHNQVIIQSDSATPYRQLHTLVTLSNFDSTGKDRHGRSSSLRWPAFLSRTPAGHCPIHQAKNPPHPSITHKEHFTSTIAQIVVLGRKSTNQAKDDDETKDEKRKVRSTNTLRRYDNNSTTAVSRSYNNNKR